VSFLLHPDREEFRGDQFLKHVESCDMISFDSASNTDRTELSTDRIFHAEIAEAAEVVIIAVIFHAFHNFHHQYMFLIMVYGFQVVLTVIQTYYNVSRVIISS
jgi:hypothetical protein